MKIVVVGDTLVSSDYMEEQAKLLLPDRQKEIIKYDWEMTSKEKFQQVMLNIEKNGPYAEAIPEDIEKTIIEDADIFIGHFCPLSGEILKKCRKLKLIGTCRGGVEHIDIDTATKMNIPVIHVIRNAEPVAEFAIGLMIAESRNIARSYLGIKKGSWRKKFPNSKYTSCLKDKKVGILGLGYIGKLVAKKLINLGVEVTGCDPYVSQDMLDSQGIKVKLVSLDELFSQSDIVSLHIRLTEETKNFVDINLLSKMKPGSYLINTARAGILDHDAIVKVLQENRIAGAAMDVFWDEPIKKEDPLLQLDNLTMTSHIAGDTVDAISKSPRLLINVMNEFLSEGKIDMLVNKSTAEYLNI